MPETQQSSLHIKEVEAASSESGTLLIPQGTLDENYSLATFAWLPKWKND